MQLDWVVKLLLRSWQRNASVVGLSDFRGKKEREEKGREEGEFFVQKSEVAKIAMVVDVVADADAAGAGRQICKMERNAEIGPEERQTKKRKERQNF